MKEELDMGGIQFNARAPHKLDIMYAADEYPGNKHTLHLRLYRWNDPK